jgi:hypothetical protein
VQRELPSTGTFQFMIDTILSESMGFGSARVKVVVASVTQPSAEYVERWQPG